MTLHVGTPNNFVADNAVSMPSAMPMVGATGASLIVGPGPNELTAFL